MGVEYLPDTLPIIITKNCPKVRKARGWRFKIPTRYMVIDNGRKRRVYTFSDFSPASHYVLIKGKRVWFHLHHLKAAQMEDA